MLIKLEFFILLILISQYPGQNIVLHCSESSASLDLAINCLAKLVNLTEITIDFGDYNSQNLKGDQFLDLKISQLKADSTSLSNRFLIMRYENNELSQLVGFKINAIQSGKIKISIFESSECGKNETCFDYVLKKKLLSDFSEKKEFNLDLNAGLFDYPISPTMLNKGSLIMVDQTMEGRIGAVDADILSDFINQSSKAYNSEFTLAISPIYREDKNETFHYFSKKYLNPGVYSISIKYEDLEITKTVEIAIEQSLDVMCHSFVFREINCSVLHTSMMSAHKFYFWYTATNNTLNLQGNKTDLLGSNFANNISKYTGKKNQFLLTSSEFMLGFNLRGFEVFAVQAGDVTVQLLNFSFCGQNSCLDRFMKNSSILSMVIIKNWKISLNTGINRIFLSELTPVAKGQILLLVQNETGIIGINENSLFPDFVLDGSNGNYYLRHIDRSKFIRFCLNPIMDRFLYRYEIFQWNKVLSSGEKEIHFGVENFKTKSIKINIKDLNSIDIVCLNETLDMTINCSMFVLSNDRNRNYQLLIDGKIVKEFNVSKKIISYFGMEVPSTLTDPVAAPPTSPVNQYLLLNSEIRFNCYLDSIEIYSINAGSLNIQILTFRACGSSISCSNFLTHNQSLPSFDSNDLGEFNIVSGHNKINFSGLTGLKKGSIFLITQNTARLAIDQSGKMLFSDFLRNNSSIYRLNLTMNMAFYFKVNVNLDFHSSFVTYEEKFSQIGLHNATVVSSNLIYTSFFELINYNYNNLACLNNQRTLDKTSNCTLFVLSRLLNNSFKIEYDTKTIYKTTWSENSYHGMQIPTTVSNLLPIIDSKINYLLSSLFKVNSEIIGFEFYASQAGTILIKLESFSSSLSNFYSNFSMQIPVIYTHKTWIHQVSLGYNKIYMLQSIEVQPKAK